MPRASAWCAILADDPRSIETGQVIKGWDQGLIGICPGEKRTLVIPPAVGYGEQGAGNAIPGGSTLNFDVECIAVN